MAVYRIPVEVIVAQTPSSCFNVWHGRADDTSHIWDPTGTVDNMIDALRDFYTACAGLYPSGTIIRIPNLLVDVTTDTDTAVDVVPDMTVGTGAGGARGLAATVAWKTSIRARRGMGRTFLGPIGLLQVDADGELHPTKKGELQTAVDALVARSSASNGWALGVYGQEAKGVASAKVLRDFTRGDVKDKLAHLTSRRD